jgi:hypothetical protein
MECIKYYSELLGVWIYGHRWYGYAVRCACEARLLTKSY